MDPQEPPAQDCPLVMVPPLPVARGLARMRLLAGTLARLGPVALSRYARHRLAGGQALPHDAAPPAPPFLHDTAAPDPGIDWHGPAPPDLPALAVPTAADFDIRLLWERGRLVDLPTLKPAEAEARLRSFVAANRPFRGPHWACGQEAAIRLVHILAAWQAAGGPARPGLKALVVLHRDRIAATLAYAMAQDNNHATSEAAGLWAAGVALEDPALATRGRNLLEAAVLRLFSPGGAFSQHSMRYQVAALEMPAFAESFARAHGAPGLGKAASARLAAGAAWLARLVDPESGRPWRLGHDDGSCFLGATTDDLRPTLARARAAFGTAEPAPDPSPEFLALSEGALRVYLRVPREKFRPSQADALHLELWHGATPLLMDAGTALYNFRAASGAPDLGRTAAHNTIAFDDDDQMPRLSRFLYGAWLKPRDVAATPGELRAGYRDWRGRSHHRAVTLHDGEVRMTDRIAGRFARATLRFRLPEAAWRLEGEALAGPGLRLAVQGARGLRLVRLPYAKAYGSWTTTPALEAWTDRPGDLVSTIRLA